MVSILDGNYLIVAHIGVKLVNWSVLGISLGISHNLFKKVWATGSELPHNQSTMY